MPDAPPARSVSPRGLLQAAAVLAVLAVVAGAGARWWWPLELATHFTVQQAVGSSLLAGLLAWARSWRWVAVCGAVTAWHVLVLAWPAAGAPAAATAGAGRPLRLLYANVLTSNVDADRLLALIEREDPDVVALVEIDDQWVRRLVPLRARYPVSLFLPREDNFGVAVLARAPGCVASGVELGPVPAIVLQLGATPDAATMIVAHALPPISGDYAAIRDAQLRQLAELVRERPHGASAVVGDLNCTPWSPRLRDLLDASGLRDSRAGFGLQASWPVALVPLRIPIDHLLVSPGVGVVRRALGPPIGSDHLPVIADLLMP